MPTPLLALCLSGPILALASQEAASEVEAAAEEPTDAWESQAKEFQNIASSLKRSMNSFFGDGQRQRLERILEKGARRNKARMYRVAVASMRLRAGEIGPAIELFEEVDRERPDTWDQTESFLRALAAAYLRQAETANCVAGRNPESCLLPLAGGGIHTDRGGAEKALELYRGILERTPDDLEVRWLFNLATMALGDYPDGVPEAWRIPFDRFASDREVGRMRNVAAELGVDTLNLCGGVVVEDFDGDGYLDILTSTWDPEGPLTYYRNQGDGTFEDRSDASRASDQLGGLNLVSADYDADGDPDVLVLRGAWLLDEGTIRNSLLRNDGGVFVDVTRDANLAKPARPTQTAVWGDFDGDGDLDLYVGNESRYEAEQGGGTDRGDYPSQLFVNQGDGTFESGAGPAGVSSDRFCKGVTAGDYDNDGDLDLYLSNIGANQLYRNKGDGTFEEVAEAAGVQEPTGRSFACWFFDYDNDGWLDLFVGAYDATLADLASEALGQSHKATPPRLYRNLGDGTFEDVAAAVGLARAFKPMGANFGDLDGDGWLDIYLTTGEPQLQSLMPNVMLRSVDGRSFEDVTTARGLGHLQKGHGVAFADFDQDGDADLYHQLGGFYPVDRFHNALFENPGHGNRFLYLDLVGAGANRDAIGARIRVVVAGAEGEREVHRAVGSISSFGGSPRRQEVGLGDAERIVRLEIRWPGADAAQVYEDVPLDALLRVTEGDEGFEVLDFTPFELARGN